jgi:adenylyl-sulfate kinase
MPYRGLLPTVHSMNGHTGVKSADSSQGCESSFAQTVDWLRVHAMNAVVRAATETRALAGSHTLRSLPSRLGECIGVQIGSGLEFRARVQLPLRVIAVVRFVIGPRKGQLAVPDLRSALITRSNNISRVAHPILRSERASRNGHSGGVLWFTGLSGSGKSTLAMAVERELFTRGFLAYVLDGDNLRHGLNSNLGFTPEERSENIRRVGEAAALFADAGLICITATISPYTSDRSRARAAAKTSFHEIYICADLETCEERDPKGLYKRARSGEIPNFTGVSAPYEVPKEPEAIIDTKGRSVSQCIEQIVDYVERNFRPIA